MRWETLSSTILLKWSFDIMHDLWCTGHLAIYRFLCLCIESPKSGLVYTTERVVLVSQRVWSWVLQWGNELLLRLPPWTYPILGNHVKYFVLPVCVCLVWSRGHNSNSLSICSLMMDGRQIILVFPIKSNNLTATIQQINQNIVFIVHCSPPTITRLKYAGDCP